MAWQIFTDVREINMKTLVRQLPSSVFLVSLITSVLQGSLGMSQTVPILAGEIETVWTSDRTSWLEGPGYDGDNGIWFGDPGDILSGFAEPSRLLRYDTDRGP